jgi:hypothetical protein
MVDKRGLQSLQATATTAGGVIGTEVPDNMRRYIYKLKTGNQFAGANQLELGYSDDAGATHTTLDYIEHATQYEMWNDPDVLPENALPIYIIPAGYKIYVITDNGDVEVYAEYEDSE